ncbi:MerR family transcriptional regulator [Streptomyces fuscichromogenes]|uniref:helix-turn-helix domain-containing protein n=1 Tax=Streptomyces fuscichromogenes TaxID=1324013 RepID=UPI003808A95C
MSQLYSVGDVARRAGLSVSVIRFYTDESVVTPAGLTEGGFQLYDVHAIARLEPVRAVRDLGAGLDGIRRVLAAETTLQDLVATHLRLVENQARRFRARRAVLRTIVRQHTTTEQVSLIHKLVSMSDDARDRLIDRVWDFVTDGLNVHPPMPSGCTASGRACPRNPPPSNWRPGSNSRRPWRTRSSAQRRGSSSTASSVPTRAG